MDGTLNQQQIDWMKSLPKRKKLLVLSHHQGFDISGENKTTLYQPVCDALGRVPDYWYWGHLHNGIVYAEQGGLRARCAGHGAIPYGVTSELDGNERVLFSEVQNAMDDEYPERVLNGYVKVRLSGESIVEEFIGEDGSVRWSSHG